MSDRRHLVQCCRLCRALASRSPVNAIGPCSQIAASGRAPSRMDAHAFMLDWRLAAARSCHSSFKPFCTCHDNGRASSRRAASAIAVVGTPATSPRRPHRRQCPAAYGSGIEQGESMIAFAASTCQLRHGTIPHRRGPIQRQSKQRQHRHRAGQGQPYRYQDHQRSGGFR